MADGVTGAAPGLFETIRAFFAALFSGTGYSHELWDVRYVPTDLEKVAAELNVDRIAADNGSKGLPRPDAAEFDYGHKSIQAYFGQRMGSLHANATARLTQYGHGSGISDLENARQEANELPERFHRALEQRIGHFEDDRVQQLDAIAKADAELTRFREVHRLEREPHGPTGWLFAFGLPVFLLAIDITFNAIVFKDASPEGGGLRAGIWMAFLLAAINVLAAMGAGYLLRMKNAAGLPPKLLGWFMGGVLALYLPFNLLVAHLRDRLIELRAQLDVARFDQIVADRQHVLGEAARRMLDSPLAFSGIESVILLLIGVVCAYVAAADGYRLDDPVPGFRRRHRTLESLRGGLQLLKDELREENQDDYANVQAELGELGSSIDQAESSVRNYFALRERLLNVHERQAKDYVSSCDALISRYRGANLAARGSVEPPSYFNEPAPKLRTPSLDVERLADGRNLNELEGLAGEIRQEVNAARARVHQYWKEIEVRVNDLVRN